MSHKYPGKLILFEGCEGSGKSTLIKSLAAELRRINNSVLETREPGHATFKGVKIREMLMDPNLPMTPKEELTLFIKGRADHFKKIIIPALRKGKIVLCDRSSPSTIAYQHYGRGLDLTNILVRDAQARKNIDFDLIILLDVNPEIGLKRKKPETRFELEKLNFHHCVRNGYLEQAENDPDGKWVIIDASKSAEVVKTKALKAIMAMLRRRNLA